MFQNEILSYAIEHDKLDVDAIQREIDMRNKEELLKKHSHKIWQGKNERWYTYLSDENKGRVMVSRCTREELEAVIVAYYREVVLKPCFRQAYEEWIAEKAEFGEIRESSISRYRADFKRFFAEDEPFCKVKLCDMDDSTLERFIKKTIRDRHLTAKAYAGLRTLLLGVFKYAKREKYTTYSISQFFKDLSLPRNIFRQNIKSEGMQVFSLEETHKMVTYLQEHPDSKNLAILLQIYTGMRVGELTALKPEDNQNCRYIKVCRTEYNYFDEDKNKRTTAIREFPKTEKGIRSIILPQKAQDVLDTVKQQNGGSEYLFSQNGKRITSKQINYRLHKVCEEIGIPPRSTHKIRRMYGSKLLADQVDAAFVQKQMGHSEILTTEQYYHYDIFSDSKKLAAIDKAIDF